MERTTKQEEDKDKADPIDPKQCEQVQDVKMLVRGIKQETRDADIYVGLDMSTSSPGLSVLNLIDSTGIPSWITYFWPQRQSDSSVRFQIQLTPLEWYRSDDYRVVWQLPSCRIGIQCVSDLTSSQVKKSDRWERLISIVPSILSVLDTYRTNYPKARWKLGIENYALAKSQASKLTQLAEATGCVKLESAKRGWTWTELSPTAVKMAMSGSGLSDKAGMLHAFASHFPTFPNFYTLFHVQPNTNEDVKPIQDIIDAFAVCLSLTIRDPFPTPHPKHPKRLVYAKSRVRFAACPSTSSLIPSNTRSNRRKRKAQDMTRSVKTTPLRRKKKVKTQSSDLALVVLDGPSESLDAS